MYFPFWAYALLMTIFLAVSTVGVIGLTYWLHGLWQEIKYKWRLGQP